MPATPGNAATKRSADARGSQVLRIPDPEGVRDLGREWRRLGRCEMTTRARLNSSAGSEGLPAPVSGRAVQRGTAPARTTGQLRVSATPDARAPQAPCRPPECLRRRRVPRPLEPTKPPARPPGSPAPRAALSGQRRCGYWVQSRPLGGSNSGRAGISCTAAAEHVNAKDVDIGTDTTEQISVRNGGAGERRPSGHRAKGNRAAERASHQRPIHENLNTRWLARSHHAS